MNFRKRAGNLRHDDDGLDRLAIADGVQPVVDRAFLHRSGHNQCGVIVAACTTRILSRRRAGRRSAGCGDFDRSSGCFDQPDAGEHIAGVGRIDAPETETCPHHGQTDTHLFPDPHIVLRLIIAA